VNVASFKNVDEEALLKIPGVVYVPMVGKVTVAMLERNLMRLYENFHESQAEEEEKSSKINVPSRGHLWLQAYTAIAVTALLATILIRK